MKIVYLITGSGGSFYCGNCYRDMIYLRAIRKVPGITASAIPLYLPPDEKDVESGFENSVYFGAISMYLREKVPFLRNMPAFFEKLLDSAPMLKMAAKRAGTTRTEGLEELTLKMIRGEEAFPEKELDRLIAHLIKEGKPDVIHLSNSLIIGLARRLKKRLNVKIVCSLLNEDDWLDEMAEPYQTNAWKLIAREAVNVDSFLTPSVYYKNLFIEKTGISGDNFNIIPLGLDAEPFVKNEKQETGFNLGYFCRISSANGFDKLVDAFILLHDQKRMPELKLHVSGGYTADDKPFIAAQIKKVREKGLSNQIKLYPWFSGEGKDEFFKNVEIMSVPVRKHDGYGLYILESNAAGVPVVQPHTGAFPEIVELSHGGITYSPDTIEALADAIYGLFMDENLRKELGENGSSNVRKLLSLNIMSGQLSEVYFGLMN